MSSNILYKIKEKSKHNEVSYNELLDQLNDETDFDTTELDIHTTQQVHYDINFTKKELLKIANYYNIKKAKTMKKEDLINNIIVFETDPENIELVERRKTLWFYYNELKRDDYFKKLILND